MAIGGAWSRCWRPTAAVRVGGRAWRSRWREVAALRLGRGVSCGGGVGWWTEQGENGLLKTCGWSAAVDSGPAAGAFSGELSPAEVRSSFRASLPGRAECPFSVSSGQCAVGKPEVPNNFSTKYLGWVGNFPLGPGHQTRPERTPQCGDVGVEERRRCRRPSSVRGGGGGRERQPGWWSHVGACHQCKQDDWKDVSLVE
jgi:hypothetical protein